MSALVLAPSRGSALTPSWSTVVSGSVDGTAVGDVDGDGRLEIALLIRGGTYSPSAYLHGAGSIAIIDGDGGLRWEVSSSEELAGFPVMADFDGDGLDDVAFCELAGAGMCRALRGHDGAELFAAGPFYYPGMSTSGPAAHDVDGDGDQELLVVSWGGLAAAYDGDGTELWRYDTWSSDGELLFGFPALGDLNGDGRPELVFGGYRQGNLYVLDARTGALVWAVRGLRASQGNFFYANGALLSDLDGDGDDEVVVALYGSTDRVLGFDGSGTPLFQTELAGADLRFMSPVSSDVDGDGTIDVLVQGGSGTLHSLAPNGSVRGSVDLGAESWVAPSFFDADLDAVPEVLVTTVGSMFLLDGPTLAVRERFDVSDGGLMPTSLAADLDRDGSIDLLTSSWWSHRVIAVSHPAQEIYRWSTLGGGAAHGGELSTWDPDAGDPNGLNSAFDAVLWLRNYDASLGGTAASADLLSAQQALFTGNHWETIGELRQAILAVQAAGGDPALESRLSFAALVTFREFVDRSRSAMGPTDPSIVAAEDAYASALALHGAGDYLGAVTLLHEATRPLKVALVYVDSFCPPRPDKPYHFWMCEIQAVLDEVRLLDALYPGDRKISKAIVDLSTTQSDMADLKLVDTVAHVSNAIGSLSLARIPASTTELQASLALSTARLTQLRIDDARLSGLFSASTLAAAEADYARGQAALAAGDWPTAASHFADAIGLLL